MSRSAVVLLTLTLLSLAMLWLSPAMGEVVMLALKCAAGLFGMAFLVALMAGRRIKFDPVLR